MKYLELKTGGRMRPPFSSDISPMNSSDCNENNIPDSCDVDIDGEKADMNENGIPDSCELAQGDLNLDGCIDGADLGILFSLWGLPNPPIGDLNGDGTVRAADLGLMLGNWRSCP
jgi:hypothetical protein